MWCATWWLFFEKVHLPLWKPKWRLQKSGYLDAEPFQGGESKRGGTKTSAGGIVKGTTQKKAIGEMLESQMSDIHKTTKTKEKKNPVKKERDEKQEEAKKLQKDIKAFLVKNSDIWQKIFMLIQIPNITNIRNVVFNQGTVTRVARHVSSPSTSQTWTCRTRRPILHACFSPK